MIQAFANPDIIRMAPGHFSVRVDPELGDRSKELLNRDLPSELVKAVQSRKAEYVAGRYCAFRALAGAGGPSIAIGSQGRLPLWPGGFVGSITHKKGFASAAAAPAAMLAGIGIDCEGVMKDEDALKIRNTISTPREREMEKGIGFGVGEYYALLFSAKESLYKALFPEVRVFFGYADAQLHSVNIPNGAFDIELIKKLTPARPAGRVFSGRFQFVDGRVHTGIEIPR